MSEYNEYRRLLSQVRDVARLPVEEAEARSAMELVRGQLGGEETSVRRFSHHRRILIMAGSIAASVAFVCVLVTPLTRNVNAAEQLQVVAQTMQDYRGWVHITPIGPAAGGPATQPAFRSLHIDTGSGAIGIAFEIGGKLCVQLTLPATKQELIYSEATGEVQTMPLAADSAGAMMRRSAELPLKLADLLAEFKAHGLHEPSVTETAEQGLQRFDLAMADDPKALPERYRDMAGGKLTIWTDPQTKLIRKMETHGSHESTAMEYTYGAPEIRDIYDLGVPRTARVIKLQGATTDGRPAVFSLPDTTRLVKDDSVDIDALRKRLNARRERDFGDGVMVECEEWKQLQETEWRRPRTGRLTILSRDGDKGMEASYNLAPAMAFLGGPGFPDGWPQPELSSVLSVLKVAVPLGLNVFNGDQAWTCKGGPTQTITDLIVKPTTRNVERRSDWASVGMRLWPGITENHPGLPAAKYAILRDPARPKLIVLECERSWKGVGHSYDLTWLDPDHDDLPVESISRSNLGQPDVAESGRHTICLDFVRLPDGRWYPAHWQSTRIGAPTTQPVRADLYGDYYRQVLPGATLDDQWYGDPSARVKAAAGQLHFPTTAPTEAGR